MYETWSKPIDTSEKRDCQFCNLDIVETDNSSLIRFADHHEQSPASIDTQKKFIKRGFVLLTNPQPWQMIQEILVLKRHVDTSYDFSMSENENLFYCALSCWERYSALKTELQSYTEMSLKESWLTLFTNDRMGATVLHAHSQPGISLLPPGKETKFEFLSQEACKFAETEAFFVSTVPGRNNEIVVYSKKTYSLNELDKITISEQLGLIRTAILSLYNYLFGGKLPLNEGMFLKFDNSSMLVYVIVPYFNEGAPQRLLNLQYYSGTPKEAAQNMSIKLQQLDEWKMFEKQGLKLTIKV
jgi:galactose-1-phosphate uridylyltransferase